MDIPEYLVVQCVQMLVSRMLCSLSISTSKITTTTKIYINKAHLLLFMLIVAPTGSKFHSKLMYIVRFEK